MRVLAVLCLSLVVLANAGGGEEWEVYKKWVSMKAQESCWGEDNFKIYTVNVKQAVAKCSQMDAPELSLPPFRSPYRFLNTLLTSAGEMERRQLDLAVRMLDLLKDDDDDFSGAATTFTRKKVFSSIPLHNEDSSVAGLLKRFGLKKTLERYEPAPYSKFGGPAALEEDEMLERLAEERVRESMMEYKLRQSLQGAASGPTNRQRLAALLENGRKRRQAPADNTKPAGGVVGAATLPESLDLGDRLAEKLKAQQERLTAKVGNFTCVLRQLNVLNERNELDLEVQKRALEQFTFPSQWFKNRLLNTYETCNKVAASLPAEAGGAGEVSLVPGLYKIKSFMSCCKEGKLRLCMYQDVKNKLEKSFGPLDKILAQTQLTEDQLFPLVIMLLHGEEMEYF